jgi:uncharacterized protein
MDRPPLNFILKVLVGSRAHGLNTEVSDYDYRGVFVQPTSAILGLNGATQTTSWIEGKEHEQQAGSKLDDTAWEIGHFLRLATHCNPTILEVFAAPLADPVWEKYEEGKELRELFPAVWNPKSVRDAFVGYGLNQRKKFLDDKDRRASKYAVAYLRTLLQAERLLTHGVLTVNFALHEEYQTLLAFKTGLVTVGQVIDKCQQWEARVHRAAEGCDHKADLNRINEFLLKVRKAHWDD